MIVTVMYQLGEGQTFDMDYYLKTHIPLVHKRLDSLGLRGSWVLQGTGAPGGAPAPFAVIAALDFTSLDAFGSAMAVHGGEIMGDVPNFTQVQPSIQFNDKML